VAAWMIGDLYRKSELCKAQRLTSDENREGEGKTGMYTELLHAYREGHPSCQWQQLTCNRGAYSGSRYIGSIHQKR